MKIPGILHLVKNVSGFLRDTRYSEGKPVTSRNARDFLLKSVLSPNKLSEEHINIVQNAYAVFEEKQWDTDFLSSYIKPLIDRSISSDELKVFLDSIIYNHNNYLFVENIPDFAHAYFRLIKENVSPKVL